MKIETPGINDQFFDLGMVVGIEGNDPSYAIAQIDLVGASDEDTIRNVRVSEILTKDGALGNFTIGSAVRVELSENTNGRTSILGCSDVIYVTDEDVDDLWNNNN